MIQKKNIFKLANEVKKKIGENKKLPSKFIIDGTTYTYMQVWYILSYAILNLNKDCKVPKIKECDAPTGNLINEKIKPNDYKSQAKRIVDYIKKNGKCPNFVTSSHSKKKISPKLSIYEEARIVVYYHNNHILPPYCTYKNEHVTNTPSSTTKKTTPKKHGHATTHGCDNMGQNNSVYCGPHSMQEVIRNLTGKVIKQSTLAGWAGTGSGGTGHPGIETAIAKAGKQLGVKFTVKWYNFSDLGWKGINKILKSKNQDCIIHNLYRNKWGHYEVVNKISGSNVKVQNSLGNQGCGSCYCGYVEDRSASEFRSYINGISQKSVIVITKVG